MWRNIWVDEKSGRLRSGWRAIIALLAATAVFSVLFIVLDVYLQVLGVNSSKLPPYVLMAVFSLALVPSQLIVWTWALRFFEQLPSQTLGLVFNRAMPRELGLGALAGFGLILLQLLALWGGGFAHFSWHGAYTAAIWQLLPALALISFFVFNEELLGRGYLFQTLLRGVGPWWTLAITSFAFALLHAGNPNVFESPFSMLNMMLAGLLFGLLYLRAGSLWLPIGVHLGWNFAQVFFHTPVSGLEAPRMSPLSVVLSGHPWISGGQFGMEGSALTSLLLIAACAFTAASRYGLPLFSHWWEWRELIETPTAITPWDISIGSRHYQWKLIVRDNPD